MEIFSICLIIKYFHFIIQKEKNLARGRSLNLYKCLDIKSNSQNPQQNIKLSLTWLSYLLLSPSRPSFLWSQRCRNMGIKTWWYWKGGGSLLTFADSRIDIKTDRNGQIRQKSNMSYVTCHLSPVICHLSLKPTATATCPPSTNSSIIHRRLVASWSWSRSIKNEFKKSALLFLTISE